MTARIRSSVSGNRVQEPIGKPLTQSAPDRTQNHGTCLRMLGDRFGAAAHFRNEGGAQPRLFVFVVGGAASLSSCSANSLNVTRTGQIRARASRNTSSAGRLDSVPASSASARRCASSAQMRAFSSGDRLSRLSSNRSAKRARLFASSRSAAPQDLRSSYKDSTPRLVVGAVGHRHVAQTGSRPRSNPCQALRRHRDRHVFPSASAIRLNSTAPGP